MTWKKIHQKLCIEILLIPSTRFPEYIKQINYNRMLLWLIKCYMKYLLTNYNILSNRWCLKLKMILFYVYAHFLIFTFYFSFISLFLFSIFDDKNISKIIIIRIQTKSPNNLNHAVYFQNQKKTLSNKHKSNEKKLKKNHLPEYFLCTALRRSHINCRWYQNTELAINRPTCLLLIQNQWHNVCVCLCLLKINNNSNTNGGSTTNTQTTVLVIDLPNTKKLFHKI